MKSIKIIVLCVLAGMMVNVSPVFAQEDDKAVIEGIIQSYFEYVNTGNATAIADLYMYDAVFMFPFARSRVGRAAILRDLQGTYDKLDYDMKADVQELVLMGDWAFARMTMIGTMTLKETGDSILDEGKMLLLFNKKEDGSWMIARYMMNTSSSL